MASIRITNKNTAEQITLDGLSVFEAQFLADLVHGQRADDWGFVSPDTVPQVWPREDA